VPGARHLPFWQALWRRPDLASGRGGPLVMYCGHGPRAWMAGVALRARGFGPVTYLDGHYARWRREGRRQAR
jgi:rhodanese-related sulfurtransferase